MADNIPQSEQMPFDEMIIARTKAWANEYDEAAIGRQGDAVTLTYRKRGDYFGYCYQNRTTGMSQWRPFTGQGMVTYPVISRSIRSKIATSVSTKVQTEIEAVRDLPEKQAAAEMAKSILKYVHEKTWTPTLDATLAELCQIQRFCWVYSDYQKTGGMLVDVPVTETAETKTGDTLYTCAECGFQSTPEDLKIDDFADEFRDKDLEAGAPKGEQLAIEGSGVSDERAPLMEGDEAYDDDAFFDEAQKTLEHTSALACPNCQTEGTLVLESRARHETIDRFTGRYEKRDTGFLNTQILSPLQTRIDSYPCAGFQYKRAGWFNYHPLIPAYELVTLAPHLADQIETGQQRWSESARLHFELANNTSNSTGYAYKSKTYRLDELVEPNVWWIAPHACLGWIAPTEWKLPKWEQTQNGEWIETDKALFTIREGETIEQAWTRSFKEEFRGAMIVIWADKIVAVANQQFPDQMVGVPWKVDAQSFYPQGEENLLKLQDAATNVVSLYYSYVKRHATSPLVVDPLGGFDENSVQNSGQPGTIITRKPVSADVTDRNWQHSLGFLEPGELSASVQNFIMLIIDIAKEESGVFNETVGNVEDQETLGGRRIALTQSLSLMTPTQQAKAFAKVEFDYMVLKLWQRSAPDEAYSLIKGTFEEEWKPQDIESFKALDIERELFVTIVEGTDVPKTQSEMEQRFMVALQSGLFQEPNPLPVELRSHIVKSVLGIDFDIGNYTAFKRLAARRYENIKQEMSALQPNEAFTILPDPMGNPMRQLRPEIVASIALDVRTAPRGTDQHLVFIEYFTDQLNGLVGAKDPDEIMVAICEKIIDIHRAYVAANAVQANSVAGVADAAGASVAGMAGGAGLPQPAEAPPDGTVATAGA